MEDRTALRRPPTVMTMDSPLTRHEAQGLVWYEFPLLTAFPKLQHRIWTRRGGVSPAPFASLNLSYSVGDDPERVRQNRRLIREAMGLEELLSVGQTHGPHCLILTGRQQIPAGRELKGIDILITDLPGVGLLIKQADCQAVILYDPVRQVVANIHCGWRGNVQNVLGQAVARLQEVFGSRPRDLYAGISPSLGPCCAEFQNYRQEWPERFWSYRDNDGFFDLWRLSRDQLAAAGIPANQIQIAGICSREAAADFFSYRRERVTGRNGTVVALRA